MSGLHILLLFVVTGALLYAWVRRRAGARGHASLPRTPPEDLSRKRGAPTALRDVIVVGRGGQLPSEDEVDALERRLGCAMPRGYREVVTTLGAGDYCGRVRPYVPSRVSEERPRAQQLLAEYWDAWEGGSLSRAALPHTVPVFDTTEGDVVVFTLDDPSRLYLLANPRNGSPETNRVLGRDMLSAMDGAVLEHEDEMPVRVFERNVSRTSRVYVFDDGEGTPPRAEILRRLRDTGRFDATLVDDEEPFFVRLVSVALGGWVIVEAYDDQEEGDEGPQITIEIEPGTGDPASVVAAIAELGFVER